MIFLIIVISMTFASAGIIDSIKKTITGRDIGPQPQDLSINVLGSAPVVVDIQEATIPFVAPPNFIDPTEDDNPTPTTIVFDVRVSDADGVWDIDDASVDYEVIRGGTTKTGNCPWQSDIDANTAEYQCTFTMNYWEEAGDWNINVRAVDLGSGVPQTDTFVFIYRQLAAMVISPLTLTWPDTIPGSINQIATEPTVVTNTGNYNDFISVTAYNLVSATVDEIPAEDFTIGITSTGAFEECNAPITADAMQNTIEVDITGSSSNPGPAPNNYEELYYCIPTFPLVSPETYSTNPADGGTSSVSYTHLTLPTTPYV